MRLIGRPELLKLARAAGGRPGDAVRALAAELEAASWRSLDDIRKAFPMSHFSDDRLTVDLDGDHCAVVAINYEKGVALVEFAGSGAELKVFRGKKSGRRV